MRSLVLHFLAALAAVVLHPASAGAQITLSANGTANNGGSSGWGIFFDLSAATPLMVTGMTTASTATAGATFSIEIFTRMGSALGGPVGSGPGSSSAGWTSLGMVTVTQGGTSGGISLPFMLPNFSILAGQTVGVAIVFTGAGPRYFGTGSGPYQTFSDSALTLTTGDARSVPFTTSGSFFAPRGLTGSVTYQVIPEPSSLALIGSAGLALAFAARRRRRSH